MNLKTGILVLAMAAGTAAAQNANVIQNKRDNLNAVQKKQATDSNAALSAMNGQSSKPSAAAAAAPKTVSIQIAPKAAAPSASKSSAPAAQPKKVDPKVLAKVKAKAATQVQANASAKPAAATTTVKDDKPSNPDSVEEKKYAMNGKRDPFVSPVVSQVGGSGCSTGKKCLEIGQIALKGVVHQDSGFIAVVTNTLNKAYFLRENDPVFNGYVVKITGDSIVFKETYQDRLGKSFTREVTKKITTPAV
jgi:Tfp pilus assembly protein PilP